MKRIRKIFKKATASAVAVAMALASFNVSYTADTAYADSTGTGKVSSSSFLSSEDMANYSGEPLSQKVTVMTGEYGSSESSWYIAGSDTDGSLVLLSAASLGDSVYMESITSETGDGDVTYASSTLKTNVESAYTSFNRNDMNYSGFGNIGYFAKQVTLTDAADAGTLYFYPAAYDTSDETVRLGASNSIGLTSSQLAGKFSSAFWLRTASSDETSKAYAVSDGDIETDITSASKAIIPAFNVDTSKVLFASSAPTCTADASLKDDTMYLRVDVDSCEYAEIRTVAEADTTGITFYNKSSLDYLYVQWNDGASDYVKSYKVSSINGDFLSASEIGLTALTSECKIWIETNYVETMSSPVAFVQYVEFRDDSHDSDPHYLSASSLKSITDCAGEYKAYYGTYSGSNVTWYIAGNDPDDTESLVLVSAQHWERLYTEVVAEIRDMQKASWKQR
jgi:hypothetical protein